MNRLITQQLNFPDNEDAKWIINELKFGTFTGAFYNPETDFFYDPGLKGSIAFNPFDYIFDLEDLTSIVELLTVDMPSDQKDPGWRSMATGLLTGIVALAEAKGQKTLEGLAELISKDPVELLSEISKVVVMDQNGNISEKSHGISSAVRYLSADEKQLSIYMGVFETKMVYFKNLVADPSQTPLNLEEWLNSKGQSKLFIMTRIKNASQAEIRNAALISTLFQAIMNKPNRPEDMNKRYYFVLDEAGNLGKIAGLDLATSLGRSYGISVLLSVQSIGQLDIKYTKEIRQTLIDSMGTSIIFRVKDPDTAKWLSEAIGEHTVKRYTDSINYGVEQNKGGGGENSSQVTEPAVKPSDILGLEKFQYYFKQPTSSEWVYVHTKFYEKPENGMYDILTNPHGEFKLPEKVESLKVQFVYNDSAATAIEKFKDDDKF
jgi:type IV secretory pathway TraG/TraD family ATPase VirD4